MSRKHFFLNIITYFALVKVLGQHINDFTLPDVNLIGEHSDAAELGRMLQLILGCAVNCEQKQGVYYIYYMYLFVCVMWTFISENIVL